MCGVVGYLVFYGFVVLNAFLVWLVYCCVMLCSWWVCDLRVWFGVLDMVRFVLCVCVVLFVFRFLCDVLSGFVVR